VARAVMVGLATLSLLLAGCRPKAESGGHDTAPLLPPGTTTPPVVEGAARDVIVVSIDTWRRDALARFGGRGDMPFLDGLVAQGLTLDDHASCSNWTFASMLCVVTGQTNVEFGFVPLLPSDERAPIPFEPPTLAGHLGAHGFVTVLVSGNGFFGEEYGADAGFQWSDVPSTDVAEELFDQALTTLAEARVPASDGRFYLHVHLMEPHSPYTPPEAYMGEVNKLPPCPYPLETKDEQYEVTDDLWDDLPADEQALVLAHLEARYRAELKWLDDQLAAAISAMEEGGLLDNALLVVMADHGEQFFEHDQQGHAWSLFTEETDVAVVFSGPTIVPGRWAGPTSHVDVAPTIVSMLGLPSMPYATGHPVGEAPADRARHFITVGKVSVRQGIEVAGTRLLYDWDGSISMYRTPSDPAQQVDVWDPTDPEAAALWSALSVEVARAEPLIPREPPVAP
jgi:arylsulfatase A-like enzyme